MYHGPGQKAWEDVSTPAITSGTDAIVQVDATTICGTDPHILEGDAPAVTDGRILGAEAVGTVALRSGPAMRRSVMDHVGLAAGYGCA